MNKTLPEWVSDERTVKEVKEEKPIPPELLAEIKKHAKIANAKKHSHK